MNSIPFSEARAHLAEALRGVELRQEPLVISRRGQAAGLLVPMAHYAKLTGTEMDFAARLSQWRAENAISAPPDANADADADALTPARDSSPGREFSW